MTKPTTTPELPAGLVDALCVVVADLESLADDQTRLCRCHNLASCMCVGSTVARGYRLRVGSAAAQLRAALGVRPAR